MSCTACTHESKITKLEESGKDWLEIIEILGHECNEINCTHTCELEKYYDYDIINGWIVPKEK